MNLSISNGSQVFEANLARTHKKAQKNNKVVQKTFLQVILIKLTSKQAFKNEQKKIPPIYLILRIRNKNRIVTKSLNITPISDKLD